MRVLLRGQVNEQWASTLETKFDHLLSLASSKKPCCLHLNPAAIDSILVQATILSTLPSQQLKYHKWLCLMLTMKSKLLAWSTKPCLFL